MPRRSESRTIIVPFSVRIERNLQYKHSSTEVPLLSNFDGRSADLLHTLFAFLNQLPTNELVERDFMHFGQPSSVKTEGRILRWVMQAGESGKERDIKLTKGDAARKRTADGVEWSSFHVYAVIPENAEFGWILVERESGDSLPSEWRTELCRFFKKKHPQFKLVLSQLRSTSLWREVENALEENRVLAVQVSHRAPSKDPGKESERGIPRDALSSITDLYEPPTGAATGMWLRLLRRACTVTKSSTGIVEMDLADDTDDLGDGFEVKLRKEIIEITARVLLEDGRQKTVRFSGAHEPFESYVIEGLQGVRVNEIRFATECKLHVIDLAREGGITLKSKWDTGDWGPAHLETLREVKDAGASDQPDAKVVGIGNVRAGA
ncbi:hypothetical protein ABZU78_25440 [Rhodococcus erythropolis]|uniref:hypothetical protein n=1 Tax=Rhodococcus erythropolis TaxID=1833 RepID=UPI00339DCA3A